MRELHAGHGDQWQYGSVTRRGDRTGDHVKKPTVFLSNPPEVCKQLPRRCHVRSGQCSRAACGRHASCSGVHATDATKYTRGFCRATLQGATQQLGSDELLKDGCYGVQSPDDESAIRRNVFGPTHGYSGQSRDDLTGQLLNDALAKEARATYLLYFHSKGV